MVGYVVLPWFEGSSSHGMKDQAPKVGSGVPARKMPRMWLSCPWGGALGVQPDTATLHSPPPPTLHTHAPRTNADPGLSAPYVLPWHEDHRFGATTEHMNVVQVRQWVEHALPCHHASCCNHDLCADHAPCLGLALQRHVIVAAGMSGRWHVLLECRCLRPSSPPATPVGM